MKNILTVFKRELGSYFNSPIAYIYLIVFIALNNGLFMTRFFLAGRADMRMFFDNLPFMLFLFIPVITMRLWAEERKENTFELLMTFPMRPRELVLGKFLSSLAFYTTGLICTLPIPIILLLSGSPDKGPIISGYLGALLSGALFLSIGLFISGLTKEQIVAFVLTALSCFLLFFLGTDFFAAFIDGWSAGGGTFLKNNLGLASHLNSFAKGVIDLKDILYFTLTSGVFLFLNSLSFEGRLKPKSRLVFGAATGACLCGIVILNWLIHDLDSGRFDLTENRTYTTSQTARKILTGLKVPLTINLYITPQEKMPTALKTLEQDITDKLNELKVLSSGKLNFKAYHIEASNLMEENPESGEKSSPIEKTLKDKGIIPFQVESIDKDEFGLKLVYSAITITYKEKNEEILPRIFPANLADLEYLLFSRIIKLTLEEKPKVALFSPPRAEDTSPEMNQLLEALGQKNQTQYQDEYQNIIPLIRNNGYLGERISLAKDNPLPEKLKTLLIINPGALNDDQLSAINKFLYQGGNVLIAAQGFEYSFQSSTERGLEISPKRLNSDINRLLQKWGIKISQDILMDENNQTIEVSTGQKLGPFALSMPVRTPNQIMVKEEGINRGISLTNRIPSLFYMWGAALEVSDETLKQAGLKKSVLFSSSPRSWKVNPNDGSLKQSAMSLPKNAPEGRFPLAVILEGNFPDWKGEAMNGQKPGKLIVIGCSQMFTDQLLGNPGNLSLLANIIDGLTLGDDIIKIRAKSPVNRELKKLTSGKKALYKFICVLLMPIALIAYAAIRLFVRGKEKQLYLLALKRQ